MSSFNQAEIYNATNIQDCIYGQELMDLLSIEQGSKVLDFGCGTGNITEILANVVGPEGQVVGVDIDAERISLAREKHSASNLKYLEGSLECIPGTNYDVVFSNNVLHRCKNKEAVFLKFSDILKNGGKFGFACGTYLNLKKTVFSPIEAFSNDLIAAWETSLFYNTVSEFKALASAHDFEIVTLKENTYDVRFDEVEDLITWIMKNTSGEFDEKHFNKEILKDYYEDNEKLVEFPNLTAVLSYN